MLSPPLVTWLDLITASPARANCIKLVKLTEAPQEERSAPPSLAPSPSPPLLLILLLVSPWLQPSRTRNPTRLQSPVWTEKTGSREAFSMDFFPPPFREGKVRFAQARQDRPLGVFRCGRLRLQGRPDLFSAYEGVFQLFSVGAADGRHTVHTTLTALFFSSTALKEIRNLLDNNQWG